MILFLNRNNENLSDHYEVHMDDGNCFYVLEEDICPYPNYDFTGNPNDYVCDNECEGCPIATWCYEG